MWLSWLKIVLLSDNIWIQSSLKNRSQTLTKCSLWITMTSMYQYLSLYKNFNEEYKTKFTKEKKSNESKKHPAGLNSNVVN